MFCLSNLEQQCRELYTYSIIQVPRQCSTSSSVKVGVLMEKCKEGDIVAQFKGVIQTQSNGKSKGFAKTLWSVYDPISWDTNNPWYCGTAPFNWQALVPCIGIWPGEPRCGEKQKRPQVWIGVAAPSFLGSLRVPEVVPPLITKWWHFLAMKWE